MPEGWRPTEEWRNAKDFRTAFAPCLQPRAQQFQERVNRAEAKQRAKLGEAIATALERVIAKLVTPQALDAEAIVAAFEPMVAKLVAARAPPSTLKEAIGIAVRDCPRDALNEPFSRWARRLLPRLEASGFNTTAGSIRVQLSQLYGRVK
jgi:hypothetical protein